MVKGTAGHLFCYHELCLVSFFPATYLQLFLQYLKKFDLAPVFSEVRHVITYSGNNMHLKNLLPKQDDLIPNKSDFVSTPVCIFLAIFMHMMAFQGNNQRSIMK